MAKKLSAYPTKNSAGNNDKVVIIDGTDGLNKNLTVQTLLTGVREEIQALIPTDIFTAADIYINADTGNDANNGLTSGTALQTHAELYRRIKGKIVLPPPNAAAFDNRILTVHLLSDLPDTDPVNIDCLIGQDVNIHYKGGVKSTLRSGTITSIVAMNPGSNQAFQMTDSALPGTWTDLLAQRIRITTAGARINTIMWVAKDLGTKQCRTSTPAIPSIYYPASIADYGESVQFLSDVFATSPQIGDAYVVEQLFTLTVGSVCIKGSGSGPNFWYPSIAFTELEVRGDNVFITQLSNGFVFYNSIKMLSLIALKDHEESVFNNCYIGSGIFAEANILGSFINAGLIGSQNVTNNLGIIGGGGAVALNIDVMLQGTGIRGYNIRIQSACVFDSIASLTSSSHGVDVGRTQVHTSQELGIAGGGITLGRTQTLQHDNNIRLWGSGNEGFGVHVQPGCMFKGRLIPTITGTLGDFGLAHATTARAFDEATGAYTTARAATWTNLNGTIAGGGLASNAHNVPAAAHIYIGSDN